MLAGYPRVVAITTLLFAAACGSSKSSGSGGTGADMGTGSGTGAGKTCPVFLPDSPWNTDISDTGMFPTDPLSDTYVKSMGAMSHLHPDFGSDPSYGIPYQYVDDSVTKQKVSFMYASESDPGPYPIPSDPVIEAGGDAHMLVVDTSECVLYELYDASQDGGGWAAGSGAIWDLKKDATRPDCWTSADAAGLPIYPGLARYEEVQAGEIDHALRFTADATQAAFVHPATHYAGKDDPSLPPMGLRMRLKADYDISGATPQARIILTALKKYGMIVADTGSSWYISGASDPGWDDDDLGFIKGITGDAFEAITTGPLTSNCN